MAPSPRKTFNTAGPCVPSDHYMLPAIPRLSDVHGLIARKEFFVLHAPRQSGKTTAIRAVVQQLNEGGDYYALYCSLEALRGLDEDKGMVKLLSSLDRVLATSKADALKSAANDDFLDGIRARRGFDGAPVQVWLSEVSAKLDKGLVVFFDEADSLKDRLLLSFLSQLRIGYVERDVTPFPRSIALVGMLSIRDYKAKIRPDSESLGSSSPFNIITEALTMPDFTFDEIGALYAQHTDATGQIFEDEAVQRAWYWSEGQPWLVNALARQTVMTILANDHATSITADYIDKAAYNLMKRRYTHVDSLLARLHEPRVKRIIEPMLALSGLKGGACDGHSLEDDLAYSRELGLVKTDGRVRPANPFYACVISRYVNDDIIEALPVPTEDRWMDAESIDMTGLLKEFQKFWAEHAERCLKGLRYTEAGPHSLFTAFIQRVVNRGAMIGEHYAIGLGYSDVVVKYAGRNYVIELKIKDNQSSLADSQRQLLGYMDRFLTDEGWLVIFDRKSEKSWREKTSWETVVFPARRTIHVVGC